MLIFSLFLGLFWLLSTFVSPALGLNTQGHFFWAFKDKILPSGIPSCTPLPIMLIPVNSTATITGVPPYYMLSFPVGGTPQTQLLGSDENNLMWTVTQPIGSQLLLSVVDSDQNPGGSPAQLITVMAGQTTQCVTTPISPPIFTVSANVTKELKTCAPWGITVVGGTPPYTITLAQTGQPVVTNASMDSGTDRFTYIDRAVPGGKLIAAVSDLEGRWATGTPVVSTTGSANFDCIGLTSSSGNNTLINEQDAQINAAANAAKRKRSTITGVVVVLVLLLFIALGAAAFWQFRKRNQKAQAEAQAAQPTQFLPSPEDAAVSTTGTGRWQISSDEKRNIRRDIEAPPYEEVEEVSAGPVASGSGLQSRSPPTSQQPLPAGVGSSTLLRSQLPKLRMPVLPPTDVPHTPEPRSVDSTSALIPSTVITESPGSSTKDSLRRGTSSRFVTFPTKPIRKNSGLAVDITPQISKAPSSFPGTRENRQIRPNGANGSMNSISSNSRSIVEGDESLDHRNRAVSSRLRGRSQPLEIRATSISKP